MKQTRNPETQTKHKNLPRYIIIFRPKLCCHWWVERSTWCAAISIPKWAKPSSLFPFAPAHIHTHTPNARALLSLALALAFCFFFLGASDVCDADGGVGRVERGLALEVERLLVHLDRHVGPSGVRTNRLGLEPTKRLRKKKRGEEEWKGATRRK